MKNLCRALALSLTAFMGVLGSGCASAGRPATVPPADLPVDPPTYLAQAAVSDCRPWDSSMVCCIKKFTLSAMSSCGATAAEVAEVLNGAKVLNEATQSAGDETPQQEDDFANNAHLPEWKQRCIRNYVSCQQEGWTGNCHDCLRYCEGQQDWPRDKCRERRSKREMGP